jgi:hypothetical protein
MITTKLINDETNERKIEGKGTEKTENAATSSAS